jgi:hypothetical protein
VVSLLAAQLLGVLAGIAILSVARRIAADVRPDLTTDQLDRRVALATVCFAPVWMYLAVSSTHLDDVLALLFATLAVRAAVRDRGVLAGFLLGLAVDSKPWALPFGCLLLLLSGRRARFSAVATMAGVVLAAWLPFFLADPASTNALHYTISNTPLSALRVIGVHTARTPVWDRPAQTILGVLLGVIAIRRGRWAAVIMISVGARIVLDPGTNRYYAAGLVAGAVLWDIIGSSAAAPWWTAAACLGLFSARFLHLPPSVNGWLTLGFFVACCTLAFWAAPPSAERCPESSAQE